MVKYNYITKNDSGGIMQLLIGQMSSSTISSIVFTCLIVAILLAFFVVWILWKKNKVSGRIDGFMYKTTNYFHGMGRLVKNKLVTNSSKGEKSLYWIVLISGLLSAILSLAVEIYFGYYTMRFIRRVFFLFMIILMIVFNARYAPVAPYFYEYNPILFFYSAISLFFAVLDFFIGIGTSFNVGIDLPLFIGNILFFGTIFFTRFAKTNFQPRDIFVYVGALIIIVVQIISFALSAFVYPLVIFTGIFELIYSVGMMILLTFFYDGFGFVKKIFSK